MLIDVSGASICALTIFLFVHIIAVLSIKILLSVYFNAFQETNLESINHDLEYHVN